MPGAALIDLARLDPAATVADVEAIRRANPQRLEFEQMTRICHLDLEAGEVAGVLEIGPEPFWARGHLPGRPLMPGVLMIEAAAQLCSFFVSRVHASEGHGDRFFGFGGIDAVKFRGVVLPGQALLVLGRRVEVRHRRAVFDTQGFVAGRMVFEARITGMWV